MSDLLRRSDKGASLGKAGRSRALERFAPEVVARKYAAIYRESINHFDHQG
jgi:hypothetical protein